MRCEATWSRRQFGVLWALCAVLLLTWAAPSHAVDGVTYREFHFDTGPWEIQVVELDLGAAALRLGVELAAGQVYGREPLDEMAQRVSTQRRRIVAAITGDFFVMGEELVAGDPVGLCVISGELVSTPNSRVALAILDDGSPVIDRFEFRGSLRVADGTTHAIAGVNQACPEDGVVLQTRRFDDHSRPYGDALQVVARGLEGPLRLNERHTLTVKGTMEGDAGIVLEDGDVALVGKGERAAFLRTLTIGDAVSVEMRIESRHRPIAHAVGGAGHLLRDGEVEISRSSRYSAGFAEERHPRTAFGFNDDRAYLVTVDGRQPGYSVGMSLVELAEFLRELGATDAINLDGGGSTTMWAEGEIKNRPSDGSPRPIANALVIHQIVHVPHVAPSGE
jgi:large repetitive protein